jgi:hypothetical protein
MQKLLVATFVLLLFSCNKKYIGQSMEKERYWFIYYNYSRKDIYVKIEEPLTNGELFNMETRLLKSSKKKKKLILPNMTSVNTSQMSPKYVISIYSYPDSNVLRKYTISKEKLFLKRKGKIIYR